MALEMGVDDSLIRYLDVPLQRRTFHARLFPFLLFFSLCFYLSLSLFPSRLLGVS